MIDHRAAAVAVISDKADVAGPRFDQSGVTADGRSEEQLRIQCRRKSRAPRSCACRSADLNALVLIDRKRLACGKSRAIFDHHTRGSWRARDGAEQIGGRGDGDTVLNRYSAIVGGGAGIEHSVGAKGQIGIDGSFNDLRTAIQYHRGTLCLCRGSDAQSATIVHRHRCAIGKGG